MPMSPKAMRRESGRASHRMRKPVSILWVREAERGETEGRKPRPVAMGVQIARPKGEDVLVMFPITSQPSSSDRFAVEIPEMEKRLDASPGAKRGTSLGCHKFMFSGSVHPT